MIVSDVFLTFCVLVICGHFGATYGNVQIPDSPCPEVFKYERNRYEWYGVITVPHRLKFFPKLNLEVMFSVVGYHDADYAGLHLYERHNVRAALHRFQKGDPIHYKIHLPQTNPLPGIFRISANGERICSGSAPTFNFFLVTLKHNLFTGESIKKDQKDDDKELSNGFYQLLNILNSTEAMSVDTTPTKVITNEKLSKECGTIASNSQPLIIRGSETLESEWPWLVAIFRSKSPSESDFICGGSLISNLLVLTAAHCVTDKNTAKAISSATITLRLGMYNLQSWSSNTVSRSVSKILLNRYSEDYPLSNDIAVLEMAKGVVFNDFIRPVCLWEENSDQEKIYGKRGVIVGWGRNEDELEVTVPQMLRVPIVSTATCRASNSAFFSFTSDKTFCAGNRDGAGPCLGDSGDGLYLKQSGNNRWAIRGIVSLTLPSDDKDSKCNLNEYFVFTDSAKFEGWIKQQLR